MKPTLRIFGLYDLDTIRAVNRLLKDRGLKLKSKTRREDDQIEVTLEKLIADQPIKPDGVFSKDGEFFARVDGQVFGPWPERKYAEAGLATERRRYYERRAKAGRPADPEDQDVSHMFVPYEGEAQHPELAGSSEDEAIEKILEYIDDPEIESWEDAKAEGWTLGVIRRRADQEVES